MPRVAGERGDEGGQCGATEKNIDDDGKQRARNDEGAHRSNEQRVGRAGTKPEHGQTADRRRGRKRVQPQERQRLNRRHGRKQTRDRQVDEQSDGDEEGNPRLLGTKDRKEMRGEDGAAAARKNHARIDAEENELRAAAERAATGHDGEDTEDRDRAQGEEMSRGIAVMVRHPGNRIRRPCW